MTPRTPHATLLALTTVTLGFAPSPASAQWTHRYPPVAGYSHHVYLEGYELPLLTNGPIDPAPSPDGKTLALASRGWLWLLDLASGEARRLTRGGALDSRPAWSPDGKRVAFVRDDTRQTSIVLLDPASGQERVVVSDSALDLDPAFSPDGTGLYYSSATAGDLDLWRLELESGTRTRITTGKGIELKPLPHPDGKRLVYLAKGGGGADQVRLRDLASGEERVLLQGNIVSMARPALSPDGRLLAVNWPASDADGWDLRLLSLEQPGPTVLLTGGHGLPLTPAWSPDGREVFFSEADRDQVMRLYRVERGGGRPEEVRVAAWSWGEPTARLRIRTQRTDLGRPAPARIAVVDRNGHPAVPDLGQARFDGQNGLVFFYSLGTVELILPAGPAEARAVQGLATPERRAQATLQPGETRELTLDLTPVWVPRAEGWLAGDHHFHLNYGGPYRLPPEALLPMAEGEDMDVLTPLLANLHTRFEDQGLWTWQRLAERPFIRWGQEVRSHFLGHIGLLGVDELFWPWVWGPGYEIYGQDDRPNREVVEFARRQGGLSVYVHPIMKPGPFSPDGLPRIPVEIVADAVNGEVDALEVACLWSDEIGSTELWYRLLDFGAPVVPSAGTDVMNNLYRTMAVGTTRVYARVDGPASFRGYLAALKAGRSFVTNGPLLDFKLDGLGPGAVLSQAGDRLTPWTLAVHTAVPVDRVELVVNGAVAAKLDGVAAGTSKTFVGRLKLPAGGWVAARALGGPTTGWPAMDSYAFAHTAPLWIGKPGSTVPETKRAAAQDLLLALDAAQASLERSYQGVEIPRLQERFAKARHTLEAALREGKAVRR